MILTCVTSMHRGSSLPSSPCIRSVKDRRRGSCLMRCPTKLQYRHSKSSCRGVGPAAARFVVQNAQFQFVAAQLPPSRIADHSSVSSQSPHAAFSIPCGCAAMDDLTDFACHLQVDLLRHRALIYDIIQLKHVCCVSRVSTGCSPYAELRFERPGIHAVLMLMS